MKYLVLLLLLFSSSIAIANNLDEMDVYICKDNITTLTRKAFEYDSRGKYEEAIAIGKELVEYFQKNGSSEEYICALSNLGAFYSDARQYESALSIGNLIQVFSIDSLNLNLDAKFEITFHQAIIYENVGDHEKAQENAKQAVYLAKQMPDSTLTYPRSLIFLAYSCSEINDYTAANRYCSEAKDIYEQLLSNPNVSGIVKQSISDSYYTCINDLAAYSCELGNIERAIDLGSQYVKYFENFSHTNVPQYVVALNNLARYYAHNNNISKAIELTLEALKIIELHFANDSYLKGRTYEHLSSFSANLGDYENACRYIEMSLSNFGNVWKDNRPGMITEYLKYFSYSYLNGTLSHLEDTIISVNNNLSNNILAAFSFLPSSGRRMYWQRLSSWYLEDFPRYINFLKSDSIIAHGYNSLLLSKGILLNSEIELQKMIEMTNDTSLIHEFYYLQNQYQSILLSNEAINESLLQELTDKESHLMSKCKQFGDYTQLLKIKWQDIQHRLNDNDIAIEFLSFPLLNCDTTIYIAMTIRNNYHSPHLVSLFDETQLDSINPDYYKSADFSKLVWGSLERELKGVKNIYFSPSGELYNIAIESTPHWSDNCMMSDRYNLFRLSSTRELVIDHNDISAVGAVVYGGIHYDTKVANMGTQKLESENLYAYRSIDPDMIATRGITWKYLPGTLEEANKVDSILQSDRQDNVLLLTGEEATETTVKNLSGQNKQKLHIATHGFFYNENMAKERLRFLQTSDDRQIYVEDNAMTRSGLLFAGAQNIFNGVQIPIGIDDGVLTAHEASFLDLHGLDLLVLSACQTGLGEIKGDGVFGLQRGFKKAGAQTIMMSLWEVSDDATKDLMTQFYANLTSGKSKREAFILAQQYVKDHDDTYGYKPYNDSNGKKVTSVKARARRPHWAAFILLDALE